jgi:hypothetical protein
MATEVGAKADFNIVFWAAAGKERDCFQSVTEKSPAARDVLKEWYSDRE